jgi:prephenate dehydrogenase (NADP+)
VKFGAVVSGQTSVKHPEIMAFEEFLPVDVQIFTCHSLHGPAFSTEGQKLVIIPHRVNPIDYEKILKSIPGT